jgi:DNA-binding transcriptional LysR family regulator
MNLDELQAFVSVAESGSFSRAAETLHRSQPAVSKRVAALEQGLDTRLFDRIGHRVILTEAGRALLPRARQILAEVEDSRRLVTSLSGQVAGTLSFGTSHHIGLHRLPPVLRRFTQRYPEVELDIHFMDSEAACQAVERGELELGIVTLPLTPPEALETVVLWPDPLTVMVARDHPLAKAGQANARQLAEFSAVLPATGTFTRQVVEKAFEPLQLRLKVSLSTNYLETIKMLVSVGLGWSILPLSMLDRDVRAVSVPELELTRELGSVRHRQRTLSNAGAALLELLTQTAGA